MDIYNRPLNIYFTVSNDEKGIKEDINNTKRHLRERIIIEATGRLEMPFIIACANANLPCVIAHLIYIKRFAGGNGLKQIKSMLRWLLIVPKPLSLRYPR